MAPREDAPCPWIIMTHISDPHPQAGTSTFRGDLENTAIKSDWTEAIGHPGFQSNDILDLAYLIFQDHKVSNIFMDLAYLIFQDLSY